MYALDFASKLFRDDETIKQRNKLKINELLNKYGESREAITQNANLADSIDYMFAHGDMLIDEVLEERRLARTQSSFPQTPYPYMARTNPNYVLPNNISETENPIIKEKRDILLERAKNTINNFEGITDYFYLDSVGNVTTARGANVDDYDTFMKLNILKGNRLANNAEKNYAYNLLQKQKRKGNYGLNYPATYYKNLTPLRISLTTVDELTNKHLAKAIHGLQKTFAEFDDFPLPLQEVLTDIYYNTGNVSSLNWPNLHQGIKNKDLSLIADNVHRKDVQKPRNDWALERIRSIGYW